MKKNQSVLKELDQDTREIRAMLRKSRRAVAAGKEGLNIDVAKLGLEIQMIKDERNKLYNISTRRINKIKATLEVMALQKANDTVKTERLVAPLLLIGKK